MPTKLSLATVLLPLYAGAACAIACAAEPSPQEGQMRVGLLGAGDSGQLYRLRDAVFVIDGPEGLLGIDTESLGDGVTNVSEVVAEGAYAVELEAGWRVERAGANDTWHDVVALLISPNPTDATVEPATTTTVTYVFSIEGEVIPFEDGTLGVEVDFDDGDAPCPDENLDGFCDVCGDAEITAGEACDGNNLGGQTCVDFGFPSGELTCQSDCSVSTAACSTCGDGVVDPGEACDPPGQVLDVGTCLGLCIETTSCDASCQIVQTCEC